MPDRFLRGPRPPTTVVAAVACSAMFIITALDYFSGPTWNFGILQTIPLLFCAYGRNRRLMWLLTLLAIAATFAGVMPKLLPGDPLNTPRLFSRSLISFELLIIASILHLYIGTFRILERSRHDLEERHTELELNHAELAAREEEIARQNEELQSQTEELERQSEELRLVNDELTRRERMLESLLSLSRDLATPVSRSETMDKICNTLGDLINGPHAPASAILQRRGDQVHVICQHGFTGGLQQEAWPFKQSFAALVLERGRTGYLEDVALRPEVIIPVARDGPPIRSVLAAPLRVEGRAVGSLEVYHTEKHAWSDDQISLIESLAAQASISLEVAELFERINEERRRLRTVLDTVPFGIAIVDAEAKRITMNPAASAMINVPAQTELDFPSLESRWRVFRNGRQIPFEQRPVVRATKGEVVTGEEYEFMLAAGRRLSVLVSAAPIHGRGNEITGAVVGWADVTQLTAMQAELDARRLEAEESSIRKSRFLAAVSHDIRTPANAISLLAELMQRAASSPTMNGEIPEIARDLKRSALTLVDLVSDVLDITRFDSGKLDVQETIVPLHELISDECRPLQQTAREKGLGFECPLPPPTLTVRTDRVKLSRILTNLITNAIKFTDKGTITVSTKMNEDGSVSIHVRDTGCGVPAQHLGRIFDEYFQLKNGDRDRSKGSGLGLAISRRLIEAMGGIITVQSEIGEGSTFTVTLPAKSLVAV